MSAAAVITEAASMGIRLWREGGRIRYRAPVGALTPALRERLGKHRAELLAIVPELLDGPAGAPSHPEPVEAPPLDPPPPSAQPVEGVARTACVRSDAPEKPILDAPAGVARPPDPRRRSCFACGRSTWWTAPALLGAVRCATCHPPVSPTAYLLPSAHRDNMNGDMEP